jgi:hypothetical protein
MEMAEQFLCKREDDEAEKDNRSNDIEEAFPQTAQRLKKFFPSDFHPSLYPVGDGCNVT